MLLDGQFRTPHIIFAGSFVLGIANAILRAAGFLCLDRGFFAGLIVALVGCLIDSLIRTVQQERSTEK